MRIEGIQPGLLGEAVEKVSESNSARALGSGGLPVYSTPSMVALLERAALGVTAPYLDEGSSTVGTALNVKHLTATPLGLRVRAEAKLIAFNGRRLFFDVKVHCGSQLIGEGTHERFIVDNARFMEKAAAALTTGADAEEKAKAAKEQAL